MRHIPIKKLMLLRLALIAYSVHFLVGYIFSRLLFHAPMHGTDAFTIELAIIVGLQLIYEAVAQVFLLKKSAWLASLISLGFALLETFIVLETTGVYRSPYIAAVMVLTFIAAAFGQYWASGVVFLIIIGFALGQAGLFKNNGGGTAGGLLTMFGAAASAVVGYLVWRRSYEFDASADSQLNAMLKTRQQQASIIIQSIADGVIVCDKDCKITLINPTAAKLTEWKASEASSIDVHLVMKLAKEDGSAIDQTKDIFNEVIKNNAPLTQSLQLKGRSNRTSIISIIVSPIVIDKDKEPVGAVAVFRDVTEQRREEQQRADFISTASHEMRTPVAAIEGYLSLALNDKVATIDPKARDYLNKAHQSTEHLGRLFQDLLTSAKAEDGRLSNHPSLVELGEFLDSVAQDLRFAAQNKGLKTEFVIGSGEDAKAKQNPGIAAHVVRPLYYVYVDPGRLREAITNLFENAVKYTDQGKISIGLTGDQSFVQLSVKDTGAGIPAEDVPHLFQKFYRVDNSATRTVGGTGLGLFICRKIVELYGGRIWVESELGKGSAFFINLPRLTNQQVEQYKAGQAVSKPLASALT